jgi:hypothetical protein
MTLFNFTNVFRLYLRYFLRIAFNCNLKIVICYKYFCKDSILLETFMLPVNLLLLLFVVISAGISFLAISLGTYLSKTSS